MVRNAVRAPTGPGGLPPVAALTVHDMGEARDFEGLGELLDRATVQRHRREAIRGPPAPT